MINYNWNIGTLDCTINENGLENVIQTIHWRYKGEDENGLTAEVYGAQSIGEPNTKRFISTNEIIANPEIVIKWLENLIDVEAMKLNLENQIELLKNPVSISITL